MDLIDCSVTRMFRPDGLATSRRCPLDLGHEAVAEPATLPREQSIWAASLWPLCKLMVPWATLILCPRITQRDEELGGFWVGSQECIALSLSQSRRGIVQSMVHECWHAIEDRLPPAVIDAIDGELDPSVVADDGTYWSTPEEHRARAFEAWVMRPLEGLPGFIATTAIDAVFHDVWNGSLGRKLALIE